MGDFVYRSRGPDGVEGNDGACFSTRFRLVEALLATGRAAEAQDYCARLLEETNDVRLFAEDFRRFLRKG